MSKIILWIKRNRKVWLTLYILLGFWLCFQLYFGQSSFCTTTYAYSLVALFIRYFLKKIHTSGNVFLVVYSFLFFLFAAEITLRFIIKYPISYGEQNGGGYIAVDRYQKWCNIRFKYLEGRKDLYTVQFDSGEIRDNNCIDYQYANDTCNALGLRGTLPAENKKIILILGDSFTEGAGAPADSSIPALLRKYITAKDTSLDVLNAGVSGNDIFFDWQMVKKLESKYKLKQLIFLMNTTDINDIAGRGGNERFCFNGLLDYHSRPKWETIYAVSFVFRLFMHNVLKLDYSLQTLQQRSMAEKEALHKIAALIKDEILPWSKKTGIDVLFVAHPLNQEFENSNLQYVQLLSTLQGVDSTKVFDCLPALKAHGKTEQLYWENDRHFKPEGYSIVCNSIIENSYR